MTKTETWTALERIIHAKSWRLVRRYGFSETDRQDIEQELWLGVLTRKKLCDAVITDPSRSDPQTRRRRDLDHVVAQTLITLLNYRTWRCRNVDGMRSAVGFNVAVGRDNPIEKHLLRLDVQQVISRLPEELAALCGRLQREPLAVVLNATASSQPVLMAQLDRLRAIFQAADLHAYLN